ncbi:hypothetical protein TWF173_005644 [Orbilia oligospora]|nr:hypothetical protein TWF173_005644 [Orbilia oligospora]
MALGERTKETLDNCLPIISQNLNNNPTYSEMMDLCPPFFGTSDVERKPDRFRRRNFVEFRKKALDMELKCVSGLFAAGSVGMMVMGSGFGTVPGLLGFAVFAYLGYTETDKVL